MQIEVTVDIVAVRIVEALHLRHDLGGEAELAKLGLERLRLAPLDKGIGPLGLGQIISRIDRPGQVGVGTRLEDKARLTIAGACQRRAVAWLFFYCYEGSGEAVDSYILHRARPANMFICLYLFVTFVRCW